MVSSLQTLDSLTHSHEEFTQRLAPFLESYRTNKDTKYTQRRRDLQTLFDNSSWKSVITKNGHATFKHPLTGVVVGWQAHGKTTADPGQVKNLADQLQKHLNILNKQIDACRAQHNEKKSGRFKTPSN